MSRARNRGLAVRDAAPLFAALGDEQRLRLISRLSIEGPLSISRLSEGTAITRQAVSKHLNALARAGLIHGQQKGRERVFELAPKRLENAREHLAQISNQWDLAIGRLQRFLEKTP